MFGKLGGLPSVAIGVVVVGVAGWAIFTQTNLFNDAPVVEASDGPIVVAGDEETTVEEPSTGATEVATEEVGDAESEPVESEASDEEAEEVVEEVTEETSEVAEEEAALVYSPPAFDVVRVEKDGMTVIAGTGPAGWLISILVDGLIVETVEADATGQFVAILDIGESETARVVTLSAKNADQILLSDAQVIIAPVIRQVAEVDEPVEETPVADAQDETSEEAPEVMDTPVAEASVQDAGEASEDEIVVADATETESAGETAEAELTEAAVEDVVDEQSVPQQTTDTSDQQTTVTTEETADVAETTEVTVVVAADDATEIAEAAETAEATVSEASEDEPVQEASEETSSEPEESQASSESVATEAEEDAIRDEPVVADETGGEGASDEQTVEVEVVEDSTPAVILVEDDTVKVLQPASESPQVLDQLSIAAISYSDEGAVQLSGFSPAGFLRVYLNNVQIAVLEVPEPGEWSTELVDVEPGVYTLRVDQVDDSGTVVQRVETPFKREEPAAVIAAAQTRKPLVSVEVVQPGSTLWAISRENYGSGVLYVRIFEANKDQIRNPHLIYPGQIFELPAPPGAKKKTRSTGQ